MFETQRRYGVRSTSAFMIPVLALLSIEGHVRRVAPDLDFQREAIPFVLTSLLSAPLAGKRALRRGAQPSRQRRD